MHGHKTKNKKKKGHREGPTDWGEWEYFEKYQRDIRSRINEHGVEEFDYGPAGGKDVPRTFDKGVEGFKYGVPSPIDDLADSLSQSQVGSVPEDGSIPQPGSLLLTSQPNSNQTFQSSTNPTAVSAGFGNYSMSTSPSSYSQSQGYGRGGVATYTMSSPTFSPREVQSFARNTSGFEGSQSRNTPFQNSEYTAPIPTLGRGQPGNTLPVDQAGTWNNFGSGRGMPVNAAPQYQTRYGSGSYAVPSSPTGFTSQNLTNVRGPSTFTQTTLGNTTPQNRTDPANMTYKSIRRIGPNNTNADAVASSTLSKEYKVHRSSSFKIGFVFRVVWIEPLGEGGKLNSNLSYEKVSKADFGVESYTSIRRFVIVGSCSGHSICLPILTYHGQGTKKRGVKPEHHAIIYMKLGSNKPPSEVAGELRLSNRPIGVERNKPREKLDATSRINYAKSYTVEHNVRVVFIGKIHDDSVDEFQRTYKRVQMTIGNMFDVDRLEEEDEEEDEDYEEGEN